MRSKEPASGKEGFADQLQCKQIRQSTVRKLKIKTRNSSSSSYFPKARELFEY
jgi:hypothetical protein